MTRLEDHDNWILMQKLSNSGRKNLSKWVENIVNKFYEEQAIEVRTSFNDLKNRFHDNFHDSFLYTIPILLFKFLIDKGVSHNVKP